MARLSHTPRGAATAASHAAWARGRTLALGLAAALAACRASPATARDDAAVDAVVDDRPSPRDLVAQDDSPPDDADPPRDAPAQDTPDDVTMDHPNALDIASQDHAELVTDARVDGVAEGSVDARADAPLDAPADVYAPVHSPVDVLAARVFAGYGATFVTARDGSFWGWGNNLSGTFQPVGPATTFEDVRTRPQRISEHLPVREFHIYTPCVLVGEEGAGSVYCWGWGARDDFRTTEAGFRDPWEVWQFPRRMGDYADVIHLNWGRCTRSDHSVWMFDGLDVDWRMLPGLAPGHMLRYLESGIMWTDEGVQGLDHYYYYDTVLHRIPGIVDAVDYLEHSCLLLNTGRVMCWGKNNAGQAGNFDRSEVCIYTPAGPVAGRTNCIRQPTEIEGLTDVVKIAVGMWRSCALRRDGTVWCWGDNYMLADGLGVLGDGRLPDEQCVPFTMEDGGRVEHPSSASSCRKRPVQVPGITDAVDLSVGFDQSCVVRVSGQVLCWGRNGYGSLGDGTTTDHGTPVPVRWY